ncbi:hypothetical protein KL930_005106 [Ogataea haglerorum]|nr:hypothetical protein KL932_005006 [Ogataea haglerorum]KAG7772651.1 hypothetical protein KL930_005106 [Ogataea haglerorum]KAG7774081.1 hypothetical protein KL922_004891 [Ogataea haglerorum]KAG7805158.1 hypothetical protein KL924_005119 [Ogataea haglerorum]
MALNKHNLFNFYKDRAPMFKVMSMFMQKWNSKQKTRGYHGEHIPEGRWLKLFQKKLDGVAQMDASLSGKANDETPMVLQTFAVLEKRLDVAVFRAMFASSVRQARQFILAGEVKVNGVCIKHPSYPLSPGDVFSVEPDRVLQALGEKKPSLKEAYKVDREQVIQWQKFVNRARSDPLNVWQKQRSKQKKMRETYGGLYNPELPPPELDDAVARFGSRQESKINELGKMLNSITRGTILADIVNTAKAVEGEVGASVFEPQFGAALASKCFNIYQMVEKNKALFEGDEEAMNEEISKILPKYVNGQPQGKFYDDTKTKKVKQALSELKSGYLEKVRKDHKEQAPSEDAIVSTWVSRLIKHPKLPSWTEVQEKGAYKMDLPWQKSMWGLEDPSKPYFTPWRPRQFIAPFAVLPKHIEISFRTCHAVYMRNPIARPGESEVISPFSHEAHERAYMYYSRKGL